MTRIAIFFSNLFSPTILKNNIVATTLYTISQKLVEFKNKMELTLNNDI